MPLASLEERVTALEDQVRELMAKLESAQRLPNWQATVGMLADDEVMKKIVDEGRRIRQEDRERAYRDHS